MQDRQVPSSGLWQDWMDSSVETEDVVNGMFGVGYFDCFVLCRSTVEPSWSVPFWEVILLSRL